MQPAEGRAVRRKWLAVVGGCRRRTAVPDKERPVICAFRAYPDYCLGERRWGTRDDRHARRARTRLGVRFAAGCWVQCGRRRAPDALDQSVYDVFWLLSFGF